MTQPSDSVYPKTRPPGSQKTSTWIQKSVPQDPKKCPPKAVIGQNIQGDVFLDPGRRFLGSVGTGFWIHTVTRLGHIFSVFEKNNEIWNVLYILLSSENIIYSLLCFIYDLVKKLVK